MKLLIIVLNKVEFLNDLLSVLVEAGITKATIMDSQGLGKHLAFEVPIFAGLRKIMGETNSHNKTIMCLLEDDNKSVQELKKLLKETDIDFTKNDTGIMLTIPVDFAVTSEN